MTHFKETLLLNDFDLVWKNLFDRNSTFLPITQNKMNYPVDIYTTDDGIQFEIAAVGLEKSDIEILTEGRLYGFIIKKMNLLPGNLSIKASLKGRLILLGKFLRI